MLLAADHRWTRARLGLYKLLMEFDGVSVLYYLLNKHLHVNNRLCVYTVYCALLRDTGTGPTVIIPLYYLLCDFYSVFTDILALN